MSAPYLGDFADDATVHFIWSTNDVDGSSITRGTDGTVHVYKNNDNTGETTTGVTDTEDFDGLTGIHACTIATTDAFYATGKNYTVVLKGAVIGGKTVNAVLAHFSIENRFAQTSAPTAADVADAVWDEALAGHSTAGTAGKKLTDIPTTTYTVPTAAQNADAVWDEALSGHLTAGSTGEALDNAGGGGAVPTAAEIADATWGIDMSTITTPAARSPLNAIRILINKTDIAAGTLTVYEEDDTTVAREATVTTTVGALPITSTVPN